MRSLSTLSSVTAALCLLQGLSDASQQTGWPLAITPVETPAAVESAQPQLHASSRGVLLSWIERQGPQASLRFAERTPSGWTAPRTVASGSNWFVNWADVPSVIRLDDGTLVGHWLQKSGAGTYAYDVRLSRSTDDGKTWSPAFTPHHDGTQTEHGFATLFQMPSAGLGVVWLDGRNMKGGSHDGHGEGSMTLRFGSFGKDWTQTADTELDARVCECCPTTVAMTSEGPIVAYRDRGPTEVRDIYVTRLENGRWSEPRAVHADGWTVAACPVNGPALSARSRALAIAWFNARDDKPRAYAAFSSDAGRTFGAPIRLDDAASLGRVDIELLADGSAIAAYMEFADGRAEFRIRRIQPDGTRSEPLTVAGIANNRSSGYPRMAVGKDELILAWTERVGTASRVRTATAALPR